MSKAIKVFARLKPNFHVDSIESYRIIPHKGQDDELLLTTRSYDDYFHNRPETNSFRFSKVFDQNVDQVDIFNSVAKPVLDSILQGYNGTIFAYGQTGSGKTFSITGNFDRYENRGIIPRSINYIFEKLANSPDCLSTVYVSYLEIYNECGYDLLNPRGKASKLEDLPSVSVLEDTNGTLHLRKLSLHPVRSEKEAYDLLFLGDTSRVIAETPMNPVSSRSHCIFTLHVAIRKVHDTSVSRAKLHLVDLAGSERAYKSRINGRTLMEACHINLSLHHLENVIVALGEKGRSHVPYRNSMMTSVLRDSLGGNCLTIMIATLSVEGKNILETLSTCRFAQRVALVKNNASINIDEDPAKELSFLRSEVQRLKNQLSFFMQGCKVESEANPEVESVCSDLVNSYLEDKDTRAILAVPLDMGKIQLCFKLLKNHVHSKAAQSEENINRGKTLVSCEKDNKAEVEKCKQIIKQRDIEISVLLSLLKKEDDKIEEIKNRSVQSNDSSSTQEESDAYIEQTAASDSPVPIDDAHSLTKLSKVLKIPAEKEIFKLFISEQKNLCEVKEIRKMKEQLKAKLKDAKEIATKMEKARKEITILQTFMISQRSSYDQKEFSDDNVSERIQSEHALYKNYLVTLQELKTEADHIKHGLKKKQIKFLNSFAEWKIQKGKQTESESSAAGIHCISKRNEETKRLQQNYPDQRAKAHLPDIVGTRIGNLPKCYLHDQEYLKQCAQKSLYLNMAEGENNVVMNSPNRGVYQNHISENCECNLEKMNLFSRRVVKQRMSPDPSEDSQTYQPKISSSENRSRNYHIYNISKQQPSSERSQLVELDDDENYSKSFNFNYSNNRSIRYSLNDKCSCCGSSNDDIVTTMENYKSKLTHAGPAGEMSIPQNDARSQFQPIQDRNDIHGAVSSPMVNEMANRNKNSNKVCLGTSNIDKHTLNLHELYNQNRNYINEQGFSETIDNMYISDENVSLINSADITIVRQQNFQNRARPDTSLNDYESLPLTENKLMDARLSLKNRSSVVPGSSSNLSGYSSDLHSSTKTGGYGDEEINLESISLTGDAEVDEEIISFYKSRLQAIRKK